MLAYLSRTDIAIKQLERLSWDWIKMDCSGGKCYGLLAVSAVSFTLAHYRFIAFALPSHYFILPCPPPWWAFVRPKLSVQLYRMGASMLDAC